MKRTRTRKAHVPGPRRWSYRYYSVYERATPFGRKFEVRSPEGELVLFCKTRRSDPQLTFYADEKELQELFRFDPQSVPRFERSYQAMDSLTNEPFAQVRKKVYKPLQKTEWLLLDAQGEPLGMVTETAAQIPWIPNFLPIDRFFPKAWIVHWGQAISGTIQPRLSWMQERWDVNLNLDVRDEIDRRLALGVTVALRAEKHQTDTVEEKEALRPSRS